MQRDRTQSCPKVDCCKSWAEAIIEGGKTLVPPTVGINHWR